MRVILLHPGFDEADDIVRNLQFRSDGQVLAGLIGDVGSGHTLLWYDLVREKVLHLDHVDDDDEAREWFPDPALSPSLELIARITADEEGLEAIRLTDTWAKPPESATLPWAPARRSVMALGFSPNGILFIGGRRLERRAAVITRWDAPAIFNGSELDDAELEELPLPDENSFPTAFAFDPDGFGLAVGTTSGFTLLVDLRRPSEWHGLRHTPQRSHGGPIHAVHYASDGRLFVSRNRTSLTVWDIVKREQLIHRTPLESITASAFSPDGHTLATANDDGTVALYDTDSFAERTRYDWKQGPLHSIAFAPDGLTAAAGATHGRVILWDL